jgi:hypothetical protein
MGQKETAVSSKNRIMIYGPKDDGTRLGGGGECTSQYQPKRLSG